MLCVIDMQEQWYQAAVYAEQGVLRELSTALEEDRKIFIVERDSQPYDTYYSRGERCIEHWLFSRVVMLFLSQMLTT